MDVNKNNFNFIKYVTYFINHCNLCFYFNISNIFYKFNEIYPILVIVLYILLN